MSFSFKKYGYQFNGCYWEEGDGILFNCHLYYTRYLPKIQ